VAAKPGRQRVQKKKQHYVQSLIGNARNTSQKLRNRELALSLYLDKPLAREGRDFTRGRGDVMNGKKRRVSVISFVGAGTDGGGSAKKRG